MGASPSVVSRECRATHSERRASRRAAAQVEQPEAILERAEEEEVGDEVERALLLHPAVRLAAV